MFTYAGPVGPFAAAHADGIPSDALDATAGGDTNTNAAVAGAVLGARHGAPAIPQRWLDCIPQRERVEDLADGLIALNDAQR